MKFKKLSILLMVLILVTNLVACNNTSYEGSKYIVEASEVKDVYETGDVIIIDARGEEAYAEGHLKNAISLAPSELVVDKPVVSTVAPKAKVERVLGSKGITTEDTVYIYDDNGGVSASRIWWTMKLYGHENVKVINGGFAALGRERLTASKNAVKLPAATYVAQEADQTMIIDFDAVSAIVEDEESNIVIVDTRSRAEYDAGRIPGAVLYPHSNNLYKDGTFMSSRDLEIFYTDKELTPETPLVVYCKSSFRATQTFMLLKEAGYVDVKVYDGAWLEWSESGAESAQPEEDAPVTTQDGS